MILLSSLLVVVVVVGIEGGVDRVSIGGRVEEQVERGIKVLRRLWQLTQWLSLSLRIIVHQDFQKDVGADDAVKELRRIVMPLRNEADNNHAIRGTKERCLRLRQRAIKRSEWKRTEGTKSPLVVVKVVDSPPLEPLPCLLIVDKERGIEISRKRLELMTRSRSYTESSCRCAMKPTTTRPSEARRSGACACASEV
ncbi:hypothetical protein VNO80_13265 [Phaseolus coccineus]|uniref:Secreted protein n=1 Tax=Phaseolus coccineus TaxID=3886 RepID=A0AAN9N5V2_PHACN